MTNFRLVSASVFSSVKKWEWGQEGSPSLCSRGIRDVNDISMEIFPGAVLAPLSTSPPFVLACLSL